MKCLYSLLALLLATSPLLAQPDIEWERRLMTLPGSPHPLYSRDLAVAPDGSTIWIAINAGLVGRSTDRGDTWDTMGNGLGKQTYIQSIFVSRDGLVFAGGSRGLARSADNGATFTVVAAEWSNVEEVIEGESGMMYFAANGGGDGVYRSSDHGVTWRHTWLGDSLTSNGAYSVAIGPDGAVFAAAWEGLYVSYDNAQSFTHIVDTTVMKYLTSVRSAPNGTLFTACYQGVYRSIDSGRTWQKKSPANAQAIDLGINDLGHLFVSVPDRGFYRSIDNGETWQTAHGRAMPEEVRQLGAFAVGPDGRIYGFGWAGHLYRTLGSTSGVEEIEWVPERMDLR